MDGAADFSSATPAPTGLGGVDCLAARDWGYRVVVQAWDFGPGRDWAREMQQATATAPPYPAERSRRIRGRSHSTHRATADSDARWVGRSRR
jgi:hypothetical protein